MVEEIEINTSVDNAVADTQQEWTADFSEEDKNIISNRNFKTPIDIFNALKEAEQSAGEKIKIPEKTDIEGRNALFLRLGKPETADKYEIDVEPSIKQDVQNLLHKYNLTADDGRGLSSEFNALMVKKQKEMDEAFNARSVKEKDEVLAEWGDNKDKNSELMRRGALLLGLDEEVIENIELAIGTKNFMRSMKKLGEAISEDNLPQSKTAPSSERMSLVDFYKSL